MNSTYSTAKSTTAGETSNDESPDVSLSPEKTAVKRPKHASRGQILILVAGALVALIGLVGLATDLGYAFAERRTMQNSADSGALAGAHTLSKSSTTAPLTVHKQRKRRRLGKQNGQR